jgi:hypothetical protein
MEHDLAFQEITSLQVVNWTPAVKNITMEIRFDSVRTVSLVPWSLALHRTHLMARRSSLVLGRWGIYSDSKYLKTANLYS